MSWEFLYTGINKVLLGICFFSCVPEDVVGEIGEGEKGGWQNPPKGKK